MKQRLFLVVSTFSLLLALAACGTTTGNAPGGTPTTVQVTETDFKIDASLTTFSPGTTYHFTVTNRGKTAHEFMIMPKSEGSMMGGMPMEDMDKMALAKVQNIAPNQTVTLDYTFPSSAAGSHPEFACYVTGHYEAGMKLGVSVSS
ncbi:MAG: hypothetical protein J2P37_23825 [Ktedonobacteraceae bacterium]|nr:hypothetical protein [Ktedonobacteraceae bacterium]MBO0792092.1 hypothetical protein [Ktedonobacteraceae bacterium]